MKKLVLISGLAMMAVLATGAEQKKPTSSAKSATHSHDAGKTPARSNSSERRKTRAMHAGQGNKKGLTNQHARAANSKGHKRGHKKYLLFGKRSG
jgi:hypothetical protein